MRILAWPASSRVSGNAYSSLLTRAVEQDGAVTVEEFSVRRALFERWDVWHMHWPQHVFSTPSRSKLLAKLAVFALLVEWTRARGTKLVWTIHNLRAHDGLRPQLESQFMAWLVGRLHGVIVLTERDAQLAAAQFPSLSRKPIAVIGLGHYLDAYPNTMPRRTARTALRLEDHDTCVAFVGRISPYKGVPDLVRKFRLLESDRVRLVVAGQPSSEAERRHVEAAAEGDQRISLCLHWIGDDELQRFLGAADLIVLPYREILNSSSVLLALSFGRPVLTPEFGSLVELQESLGGDWVRTYRGELTARTLRLAIASAPADEVALERQLRRDHDWGAIGASTRAFYEDLVTV